MTDPNAAQDPSTSGAASPTPAATAPAGWYQVAPGSTQQRWWDGTAWTEHVHDPALAATAGPLTAPAGTSPNTVWFWLLAVGAPLIQLGAVVLESAWFGSLSQVDLQDPAAITQAEATPTYLMLVLIGWVSYGLYVLGAGLDYRALRARGVPRPFHWAWAFLSLIVYAIGRTVVVRRRTGSGMAPLWVLLGLGVVAFIAGIVVAVGFVAAVASQISSVAG